MVFGDAGVGNAAGPSPDAVAAVAQRLGSIAREIDAVRLALGPLRAMDWRSKAAAAFGESMLDCNTALAGVVRDVEAGAQAVQLYALALESAAPPGTGTGLGQWFNSGAG